MYINSFQTPFMKKEFERIANKQPVEHLSMKRYSMLLCSSKKKFVGTDHACTLQESEGNALFEE